MENDWTYGEDARAARGWPHARSVTLSAVEGVLERGRVLLTRPTKATVRA